MSCFKTWKRENPFSTHKRHVKEASLFTGAIPIVSHMRQVALAYIRLSYITLPRLLHTRFSILTWEHAHPTCDELLLDRWPKQLSIIYFCLLRVNLETIDSCHFVTLRLQIIMMQTSFNRSWINCCPTFISRVALQNCMLHESYGQAKPENHIDFIHELLINGPNHYRTLFSRPALFYALNEYTQGQFSRCPMCLYSKTETSFGGQVE